MVDSGCEANRTLILFFLGKNVVETFEMSRGKTRNPL